MLVGNWMLIGNGDPGKCYVVRAGQAVTIRLGNHVKGPELWANGRKHDVHSQHAKAPTCLRGTIQELSAKAD